MEDYHILERIGEGAFAKVYRGRRKYSGQIVALKFISKRGKTAKDLQNFRQEISILRRLHHCNIIAILDSFETTGEFCMVTEYALGDLFQVLEDDRQLPEEEIREIAIQLLRALHVLHTNRIIHRDMKPQNILIGSDRLIKLGDFGFARGVSNENSLLTSIKGTPLYMAPELVQEKPYNYTVDLWSLGVILYELAVGQPPFCTNRIDFLIQKIIKEPVQYPSTLSSEFQSFLAGLLNKDPSKRLTWPDLFKHPFVRETREQLEQRKEIESRVRRLPQFFRDENPSSSTAVGEAKPNASAERLRDCEWKAVDPETGLKIDDLDQKQQQEQSDRSTPSSSPSQQANQKPHTPKVDALLQRIHDKWHHAEQNMDFSRSGVEHISEEEKNNFADILESLCDLTPPQFAPSFQTTTCRPIFQALYRWVSLIAKSVSGSDQIDPVKLATMLRLRGHTLKFVSRLFDIFQKGVDCSDVLYQVVRCCMVFSTVLNSAKSSDSSTELEMDFRAIYHEDVHAASLLLHCDREEYHSSRSKALKWVGSMLDRSKHLDMLMEELVASTIPESLTDLLSKCTSENQNEESNSQSEHESELGRFAIFGLSAIVQPDGSAWGTLHSFPVTALVDKEFAVDSHVIQEIKSLYKLRIKVHANISSLLVKKGLNELVLIMKEELEVLSQEREDDSANRLFEEEDNDESVLCCVLKLFLHCCRASSPFSKKLLAIEVMPAWNESSIAIGVVNALIQGIAAGLLNAVELYYAIEFFCVAVRRGLFGSRLIDECSAVLYPVFISTSHMPLLSSLCSFFSDAMEFVSDKQLATSEENTNHSARLFLLNVSFPVECQHTMIKLLRSAVADHEVMNEEHSQEKDEDFPYSSDQIRDKAQLLSCYHIRAQGFLDSAIVLLLRIATKYLRQLSSANDESEGPLLPELDETANPSHMFGNHSLWSIIGDLLGVAGNDLLSPWGIFCLLKLVRAIREGLQDIELEMRINQNVLPQLVNLLELRHIQCLFQWPEVVGGGSNAVKALIHAIVKVLGLAFMRTISDDLLVSTQEVLYDSNCVEKLLLVLDFVYTTKEFPLESSILELPISFLSRLVASSLHFGTLFVNAKGLQVIKKCHMLSANESSSLIIDTLLIVSHLAKSSKVHYEAIHEANLIQEFHALLSHREPMVRAKTCNCIGNLCRYSTTFYDQLVVQLPNEPANASQKCVLDLLIDCLGDSDAYVRRFACFAIGNTAFHNSSLYAILQKAIPLLIKNLNDQEEKIRSNAGGALGNLARNSDELSVALCQYNTPSSLLQMAFGDPSSSSRRIALFSLGNLCLFPACVNALLDVDSQLVDRLEKFHDSLEDDEVSRKNIRRIIPRIAAASLTSDGDTSASRS